jgi:hypothetical protein
MLSFQDFFAACVGDWKIERTYHSPLTGEVERSHTKYAVQPLPFAEKQQILAAGQPGSAATLQIDSTQLVQDDRWCPGFAIAFDTVSDRGDRVSMRLKALFVPDSYVVSAIDLPPPPLAAQVAAPDDELIQGYYLRDEGYSEAGAIAARFTYQPIRQTLEMTTYYKQSVAVDQMRLVSPDLRLRTIVTYDRPAPGQPPTVINLVGFGVEQKV